MSNIESRLQTYLSRAFPDYQELNVHHVVRIPGGASCETYRFQVDFTYNGERCNRKWILRRSPTAGLIDTERRTEYNAYLAFKDSMVPVPRPILLEERGRELNRPFFITEEILDSKSETYEFNTPSFRKTAEHIGRQFWSILGEIAKADPVAIGMAGASEIEKNRNAWQRELKYWKRQIEQYGLETQPLAQAAIRWLRDNPPRPPQKVSVVHGDYRSGNFMYNAKGDITAILDWEMCHLGDPFEDLAWAMTPVWSPSDPDRPGRLLARQDAIQIWEASSGLCFDEDSFRWWEIFNCVKGIAIWLTGGYQFVSGKNPSGILLQTAWYATDIHLRSLANFFREIKELEVL